MVRDDAGGTATPEIAHGPIQERQDIDAEVTPFFSVCIPVHDDAEWLAGAIESVLAQTYDGYELVISDNASSDDIRGVVDAFDDPRIRYHRCDRLVAVHGSFNRALSLAEGTWVHLLSADDRLHPSCLERVAGAIAAEEGRHDEPVVLVAANARRIRADGLPVDAGIPNPLQRRPFPYRRIAPGIHGPSSWLQANAGRGGSTWMVGSLTIRRDTLDVAGPFRPEMEMCADLELVLRLAAHGPVLYLDEPVVDYTVRARSASHPLIEEDLRRATTTTMRNRAWLSALAAHQSVRSVADDELAAVRGTMARSFSQRAVAHRTHHAGRGAVAAWRDVGRAVRASPRTALGPSLIPVTLGAAVLPRRALRTMQALGHRFGYVVG